MTYDQLAELRVKIELEERAKIVKWLRSLSHDGPALEPVIRDIERGVHRWNDER